MAMTLKGKGKGIFDKMDTVDNLSWKRINDLEGNPYLVTKLDDGSFHVFAEIESKQAARDCGVEDDGKMNTRQMWAKLWK